MRPMKAFVCGEKHGMLSYTALVENFIHGMILVIDSFKRLEKLCSKHPVTREHYRTFRDPNVNPIKEYTSSECYSVT
jgi:hypothetical protein